MIEIRALTKRYEDALVLKDIDIKINDGELVLLVGESGSGKSTLLSIISLLQKPTSGAVIINGVHISKLPDIHASRFRSLKIGLVPQSNSLIDDLTLMENLTIPQVPLSHSPKEIEQYSLKALKRAHILHKKESLAKELSGGEKQRGAIARALVNDAKILLFDEPTASLDSQNNEKFIALLRELKDLKKTIIIATHDSRLIEMDFVDKILHIKSGEIDE